MVYHRSPFFGTQGRLNIHLKLSATLRTRKKNLHVLMLFTGTVQNK